MDVGPSVSVKFESISLDQKMGTVFTHSGILLTSVQACLSFPRRIPMPAHVSDGSSLAFYSLGPLSHWRMPAIYVSVVLYWVPLVFELWALTFGSSFTLQRIDPDSP